MLNETYIVQEGDTVLSVAKLFEIRLIDLIEANNLQDVYELTPGVELIIPTDHPLGFRYYVVKEGDTLSSIARQYGLDTKTLAEINGLEMTEYLYPNQKLLVPKEGVYVYITQEGDTMETVYDQLHINPDEVEILNQHVYLLPEQLISYRKKGQE